MNADNSEQPNCSQTLLWGTWELWCDLPSSNTTSESSSRIVADKNNWLNQVKSVGLFDSAEGFWGLANCTLRPSQLPPNSSYYLFRKHIAPMWEHEANRRGGKWVVPYVHPATSPSTQQQQQQQHGTEELLAIDDAWQKLCLGAIGELFPGEEEEICGVTVSRGKGRASGGGGGSGGSANGEWKLCVWTRTAEDEAAQMQIAEFIKQTLGLGAAAAAAAGGGGSRPPAPADKGVITFMVHRELMEAKQCFAKKITPSQPFGPRYSA